MLLVNDCAIGPKVQFWQFDGYGVVSKPSDCSMYLKIILLGELQ
jgi:hypothetical protein